MNTPLPEPMILGNRTYRTAAACPALCLAAIVLLLGCGEDRNAAELPIPRKAAVQFQQAEQAYQVGAYQPALMLADSVERRAPDFSGVYVLRGQVFTALDRYEEAAGQLERAADLDPDNPAIHFNWATNAYRREQYREAVRRFEKVLDMIENRDRVNIYAGDENGREARYAVLLQMGRAYDDLGVADTARMRFEEAIESMPQKPEAYKALSELLEKLGEFDQAIVYARKALERAPENVEYKYGLGLLLVQMGQYEAAIPYLEQMAEERSWHHGSRYNLGQAYMHMGEVARADTYLAVADSLQQAHAALGKLGDQAEVNPNDLRLWVEYGNKLRQAGRLDDAKKAYRHALTLRPNNLALQNNLAILAMESGDTREAIMRYRAILQRNPQLPDVWLNLGVAYSNAGQAAAATEAWQNVLKYDPDHATARTYIAQYGEAANK